MQDGRRKGSLHGEHGAPMERVPWITASIKGLTVTGLEADVGADGRQQAGGERQTGGRRREHDRCSVVVQDWTAWTEGSKRRGRRGRGVREGYVVVVWRVSTRSRRRSSEVVVAGVMSGGTM